MAGNTYTSRGKHNVVHALEEQVNESETSSFEVGEQRERNHRYVTLQPLGNELKGRSHYISPDVLDAVEGKKAIFSETFLSARRPVRFVRCAYPGEAEEKTEYVRKTLSRNEYEQLFRDAWHDAFVAKRCVFLVEWFPDTKETSITLDQSPIPVVQQQLGQMGEVIEVDDSGLQAITVPSINGPMQLLSGELTVQVADGYAKLTLVQPERYFRDPNAAYVKDSQWATIQEDTARGVLIDRGFDPDQVMGLNPDYRFRSNEEDSARKAHDSSWTRLHHQNRIDEQDLVEYYRTWTWLIIDEDSELFADLDLSFEPRPGYRLYEIHWSRGEVLKWADGSHAVAEVPEVGIFEWSEMKISHAENGMCTADVVAHTQKTVSGLKRLIIDNQQMVNNTRYIALSGSLKNPRDLLDTSIGGTLWAKRTDAVTALPTPQLSPMTMQVLGMMKQDSEERSGISGLAKGMNTDAVKYQNADNMIDRLTTAGQRRVTSAARDFAKSILVPMSQYIVHLAMRNDKSTSTMEIAGQMRTIAPQQWQDEDLDMEVATALTPDEAQRLGQQMLMVGGMIAQDPAMALSFGPKQRHALYDVVFDMIGISDTSAFMLPPDSPEYQQAAAQQQQQMAQQQQKAEQKEMAVLGAQVGVAQAQQRTLLSQDMREWQKFDWDRTDDMQDNMRQDQQASWDYTLAKEELALKRASNGQ